MSEKLVRAIAQKADLRYVVVKNRTLVQEIADQHGVRGALLKPFGNIITSSQLLATQLKGPGAVTVTVLNEGVLSNIEASSTPFGLTRAMIPQSVIAAANTPSESPLISHGCLTVRRRLSKNREPDTGIVELTSPHLAKCVAHYLHQSEQIRSSVGLATSFDRSGVVASGGFLIQAFPGTKDESLADAEKIIEGLPLMEELFRPEVPIEEILDQLSGSFDVEILAEHEPKFFCPCSREKTEQSLLALGTGTLAELIAEGEEVQLRCEFCREQYSYSIVELGELQSRIQEGEA